MIAKKKPVVVPKKRKNFTDEEARESAHEYFDSVNSAVIKDKLKSETTKALIDLDNCDDLPEDMKKFILNGRRQGSIHPQVMFMLKLFEEHTELTLDQLWVAIFRQFKINMARHTIQTRCSWLVTKKKIMKVGTRSSTYKILR